MMLSKEIVSKTVDSLPDSFSIDELVDRLVFIEKIKAGMEDSEAGKVVSIEEVQQQITSWSK